MNLKGINRRKLGAGLVGLVMLTGAGFWLGHAVRTHAIVIRSLPSRPAAGVGPEFEDVITAGEQMARTYLHSAKGLVILSRLYHANGYFNEALVCYAGLGLIEPNNPRWPHLQASILAGFGRLEEALPLEQRAVDLRGDYLAARLRLGDIQLKSNQLTAAISTYNQALAAVPHNVYALLGVAKCSLASGDWMMAREKLRQCIEAQPGFIGGLSLMATVAEHFGDQGEADSLRARIGRKEFSDLPDPWLDDLIVDCVDPYRLSVVATVVNLAGDPARARNLLERAIMLAPRNGSYHRQLALLLSEGGNSPAARDHFAKAVALTPYDADAWLLYYQLLARMGDSAAAAEVLASGLMNCPDSASLHLEQARRWNAAGHLSEALFEYQEAQRLNPSETQALIEMAQVLLALNRESEALAALHETLRNQPEHPLALATLAFHAISKGNEAEALQWWEHVRRQPRTPAPTADTVRRAYRQRFGHDLP